MMPSSEFVGWEMFRGIRMNYSVFQLFVLKAQSGLCLSLYVFVITQLADKTNECRTFNRVIKHSQSRGMSYLNVI